MTGEFEDINWDELAERGYDATNVMTPNQMRRRILWDIVPCNEAGDTMRALGITPSSDEVEEMEHRSSHDRLDAINSVLPIDDLLEMLTAHGAEAIVASLSNDHEHAVDKAERDEATERLKPILHATSRAIVAELLDLGYIHFPHMLTVKGGPS